MLDEYVLQSVKARFRCPEGHIWEARPGNVMSGKGCPKCGRESAVKKMRLSEGTVRTRLANRGIELAGEYVGVMASTHCPKRS